MLQVITSGSLFDLEVSDEKKLPQFDFVASSRSPKCCWPNQGKGEAEFTD
jgi:hypothetical protein